jgi:hypothetical protein
LLIFLLPLHASAQIEIAPSPSGSAAHYNALVVGGGSSTDPFGSTVLEVREPGSLPLTTGSASDAGVLNIIAKDEAFYALSIMNTTFSTDVTDAFSCFQSSTTGGAACDLGASSLGWNYTTGEIRSLYGGLAARDYVRIEPLAFATLPACSVTIKGRMAYITDSNTNVWGATAAAGGANNVGVSCNGTVWTVFSK